MRKHRATLIALASVLAVYFLVILPVEERQDRIRTELPQKLSMLEKQRRFIDKYSAERDNIDLLRQELLELESIVIPESDPSLASASLQSRVQDIAESAGIKVNSIRALSPVSEEGYSRLPVYVDGNGMMKNISSMLRLVDQSPEMLSVERIEISSTSRSNRLRIRIQLAGLMRNE